MSVQLILNWINFLRREKLVMQQTHNLICKEDLYIIMLHIICDGLKGSYLSELCQ